MLLYSPITARRRPRFLCLMARFASSSAATSAPPITETETPAASEAVQQFALRFLAGADHDRFDVEHDGLVVDGHMQSAVVDAFMVDSGTIRTFRFFSSVRWIQPVVFPRPPPTLLCLRCRA